MFYRILCLALLLSLSAGCTNMFFYPIKEHLLEPKKYGISYDDIYFPTTDGLTLHGWLLPAKGEEKATILFLHGNAQNISTHVGAVFWLPEHGYSVFIIDYRGYGKSEGSSEIHGIISDVRSAISYSIEHMHTSRPFIVMGQSLGASLAIYPVVTSPYKNSISGIVLVSPFSDFRKIAREYLDSSWITWLFQWPLSLTINNEYSPIKYISALQPIPVAILASHEDEIIPYEHAVELQKRYAEHATLIDVTGKHNDVFAREENRKKLLQVLQSYVEER